MSTTREEHPIFAAIKENNVNNVKDILDKGIDLSITSKEGKTPAEYAGSLRHRDCVKIIAMSKEAPTNDSNQNSTRYGCALYYASSDNDLDTAECLVKQKASLVWSSGDNGNGILHEAIRHKNKDLIKLFLKSNINLAHENKNKLTALQFARILAVKENNWEIIEWIARVIYDEKLTQLNDKDIGKFGDALSTGINKKVNIKIIELLLKVGASFAWTTRKDEGANYAIHLAVINDDLSLLKLLLNYKPDLNVKNNNELTPFELALSLGKWQCVELLAEANCKCTNSNLGGEYLLKTIENKQWRLNEYLIQAGALLSVKTENEKNTCLHLAVIKNDVLTLNMLLEKDIDRTFLNNNRKTAIELACELEHWDCAQAIIELDLKKSKLVVSDKYIQDMHYLQALYFAIEKGNYSITKLLLDLNVPYTKENSEIGNIAIYMALKINNKNILALLLQKIDLTSVGKNKDAHTPLDIAKELKATNCYELLDPDLHENNSQDDKLIDVCIDYLRKLELSISLKTFKKKPFLTWVDGKPNHIEFIANKLASIKYSNRESIWRNVIEITKLFKASLNIEKHAATIAFDSEQLQQLNTILQFCDDKLLLTQRQMTNRMIDSSNQQMAYFVPYAEMTSSNMPLSYQPYPSSSFMQTNAQLTMQPLPPPYPTQANNHWANDLLVSSPLVDISSISTSNAATQHHSNITATQQIQALPNISYVHLEQLNFLSEARRNNPPTGSSNIKSQILTSATM